MTEIPLTRGLVALVDEADADAVLAVGKWGAVECDGKMYARRSYRDQYGMARHLYMHTFIGRWPRTDHVNGDGLDNRRANLRPATPSQNSGNSNLAAHNTSGYKGVNYYRRTGRWRAYLSNSTTHVHLGYFDTAEEAAHAYDAAALARWGEYARLNFPQEMTA